MKLSDCLTAKNYKHIKAISDEMRLMTYRRVCNVITVDLDGELIPLNEILPLSKWRPAAREKYLRLRRHLARLGYYRLKDKLERKP